MQCWYGLLLQCLKPLISVPAGAVQSEHVTLPCKVFEAYVAYNHKANALSCAVKQRSLQADSE